VVRQRNAWGTLDKDDSRPFSHSNRRVRTEWIPEPLDHDKLIRPTRYDVQALASGRRLVSLYGEPVSVDKNRPNLFLVGWMDGLDGFFLRNA